jgi:hypothetical protein
VSGKYGIENENPPVPSGSPTPHNISNGWNAKELDRGMKGDNKPRDSGATNPVDTPKLDRFIFGFKDWTTTRCVFQARGEMAEVLIEK